LRAIFNSLPDSRPLVSQGAEEPPITGAAPKAAARSVSTYETRLTKGTLSVDRVTRRFAVATVARALSRVPPARDQRHVDVDERAVEPGHGGLSADRLAEATRAIISGP
jgi:hypothetical protein